MRKRTVSKRRPRVQRVWVIEHSFLGGTSTRRLPKTWKPYVAFVARAAAKDYIRTLGAREHFRIRPYINPRTYTP